MKEQIDNLNHLKEIGTEFAEQQQKETQSLIGDVQKTCRSQIEKNEVRTVKSDLYSDTQ